MPGLSTLATRHLVLPPRPLWRGGGGSVQRIGWIPPVAQCLETHAERIDEHEPAYKSFAETGDFADNFQRPKSRNPKSAAPEEERQIERSPYV